MLDILFCFVVLYVICVYRKSVLASQKKNMEELQQQMHKLHCYIDVAEKMNRDMQDFLKDLEKEKEDDNLTFIKKKHEVEISQRFGKISELESNIQELQEMITNLKKESVKEISKEHVSVISNNLEELARLQAEKRDVQIAYFELQNTNNEVQAQNAQLEMEGNELLLHVSELQSKLVIKLDNCNAVKEETEAHQEENGLMKAELETLKGKVNTHLSKGNSVFAEVEDGRQQLKNQIKKQKLQVAALQKSLCQTSLTFRNLLKEKARLCEELTEAKQKVSAEELLLQLRAYNEHVKDLETAERAWTEEKAASPVVLSNNYESMKMFDHLLKEEGEKSKKLWARYEDIMMQYIAMTDEAVALKKEIAVMESMKLSAGAEIAEYKQEIEKKGEGYHEEEDVSPVVKISPIQETDIKKKCRFAPETAEPSSRKPVAKKETNKIPYLKSS